MPAVSTIIAGAGLAASIGGGISQMSAQKKAAKAAQANANRNNALQQDQFTQVKQMYAPYVSGGQKSFDLYNNSTGANGQQAAQEAIKMFHEVSPDYADALKVGTQNVLQTSANSGGLLSGARLKGVMEYGGDTFNKFLSQWRNALLGSANVGIGAVNSTANAGQNFVTGVTNNNNNATSARMSSYGAQADAITGMAQNMTDIGGWWAGKRFPSFQSSQRVSSYGGKSVGTVPITPGRTLEGLYTG